MIFILLFSFSIISNISTISLPPIHREWYSGGCKRTKKRIFFLFFLPFLFIYYFFFRCCLIKCINAYYVGKKGNVRIDRECKQPDMMMLEKPECELLWTSVTFLSTSSWPSLAGWLAKWAHRAEYTFNFRRLFLSWLGVSLRGLNLFQNESWTDKTVLDRVFRHEKSIFASSDGSDGNRIFTNLLQKI